MISVVIPVYNRAQFLREAVSSVVSQTFHDWECVISDNASTDNTYEVACELARSDSRIRVVQNASNLGPVLNWKAGVQEAKGEWVKILFSDDMLEPTYLEETIKRTSSPDVGAVLVRFSDAFRFGRSSWSTEEFLARSFLPGKKVSCSPSAFLLKREAVLEALSLRFETPAPKPLLSTGVGYDFACVVTSVLTGRRVELVDSILVHYRAHPDNLTSSLGSLRTATLLYCDAYHEIIRYCRLPEFLKVCFHGCLVIRKIYYGFRLK